MILTNENFLIYAAHYYTNNLCESDDEFFEDLDRIKYIKKIFNIYEKSGEVNVNLLLNHFIILYNTFDSKAITKILFFKLPKYHKYLKTLLYFTGHLPESINGIVDKNFIIDTEIISFDANLFNKVKDIYK